MIQRSEKELIMSFIFSFWFFFCLLIVSGLFESLIRIICQKSYFSLSLGSPCLELWVSHFILVFFLLVHVSQFSCSYWVWVSQNFCLFLFWFMLCSGRWPTSPPALIFLISSLLDHTTSLRRFPPFPTVSPGPHYNDTLPPFQLSPRSHHTIMTPPFPTVSSSMMIPAILFIPFHSSFLSVCLAFC